MKINERVYMYYGPHSFTPLDVKIKIKINKRKNRNKMALYKRTAFPLL